MMFFVFMMYALFASVFTIAKIGLFYSSPFFFVGFRMVLAGLLMAAYLFCFRRDLLTFKKKDMLSLLKLAFFNIYLTNTFEFWGLQYLTSFKTCFIYSLSPFLSAFFSFLAFNEKLSLKKWGGLFIGLIGLTPILLSQTTTEELTGHFWIFSWAELAVLGAAGSSVYGWILLKQLVQEKGYSPLFANGFSMIIGGLFSIAHSLGTEEWQPFPVTEILPFLACTLLLILVSNLICYNLYGWLLTKLSATFMSFAGLSTPLFSAFLGWLFLGEKVTWPFYVSLFILGYGLVLFYQEEMQPSEKPLEANPS
jgi:drug/metabolite transporter (DMT)-like permease